MQKAAKVAPLPAASDAGVRLKERRVQVASSYKHETIGSMSKISKGFASLPWSFKVGAIVALLGPICVVGAYIVFFHSSEISSNPSDWADFGGYVGGTLGWLLSLLALIAIYVTYLNQREMDAGQKLHADKTIFLLKEQNNKLEDRIKIAKEHKDNTVKLLEEQNKHLEQQVNTAIETAFEVYFSSLIQQLIQSILLCHRDHNTQGTVVGHHYFGEYSLQLWNEYIDSCNRRDNDPWRIARTDFFSDEEGNWISVRGQIEQLAELLVNNSLSEPKQSHLMMAIINQLTPGIALFFAVDIYLNNNKIMKGIVEKFAMLRYVNPDYQDALIKECSYLPRSFSTPQQLN